MRLKLDENLGQDALNQLIGAGHDVASVLSQDMCGTEDRRLLAACAAEERCLVTLDTDFGNPMVFPPDQFRGIVLLRIPGRAERAAINSCVESLIEALQHNSVDRKLWVIQPGHPGRVREYDADPENT